MKEKGDSFFAKEAVWSFPPTKRGKIKRKKGIIVYKALLCCCGFFDGQHCIGLWILKNVIFHIEWAIIDALNQERGLGVKNEELEGKFYACFKDEMKLSF